MFTNIVVLGIILVVALVLFALERIPSEVTALGVLLALVFTKLLPADQAFAGFGSDAVITILGLLILTAALERTGVVEIAGNAILRRAGSDSQYLLLLVMIASATISAFISNTASTAFFLPVVFGIARKLKISATKLLMPMAFSSILSSSVTLVSTSTNVVVSGVMTNHGLSPMGMFELAPVGVPIAVIGVAYMYFARRFIPNREAGTEALTEEFGIRPYLSELVLLPGSPLIGRTLREANLPQERGLRVLRIMREMEADLVPRPSTELREKDILLVEGSDEDILKVKSVPGIEILADVHPSDPDLSSPELGLAKATILPGSPLIGRTLEDFALPERYNVQILGLNHHGVSLGRNIRNVRMGLGDVLLVQGRRVNIARLQRENIIRVLGQLETLGDTLPRRSLAPMAMGIFVGVLALGSLKIVTLPVAMMLGAFLVFITRCITPPEAYGRVEWKAILLIGSMLSLGVALEHSGVARQVAGQLTAWLEPTGPYGLLALFFALTVLLTQPMSNQAAAIVILPIAIETAVQTGLNPRTFSMMVAVAASCSYLTPLEPSCMMVYGPGRYRFADFLKMGAPLTVIIFAIAIVLVPRVWPLR